MVPVARPAGRSAHGRSLFLSLVLVVVALIASRADAAVLTGTVVDPQGRAVPAVRVIIVGPLGSSVVRTDADGRFEVPGLAGAAYRVMAEADGWHADAQAVSLADDEQRQLTLTLDVAGLAESIVVSASQVEVAAADAPASVTVIVAADLRARQSEDLAGALRPVPGLTVSRNGGRGALTSIFPRGGESDYTLFLVDGMRLNAFGGGADLSQLALGNVERIEVVRGPQSAVYGSDAIGGVVQIVTAHGGPTRGEALLEGGSESTSRALASGAGAWGRWTWGASAERGASDGFTGTAPASGETVSNDDWWQRQLAGSLAWQRSADTAVRLHVRSMENERGFPGPFGSNPIGAFPGVDTVSRGRNDNRQVAASASHPWSRALAGRVRQRWALSFGDFDGDFTSPYGPSMFETRRLGLRAQTDIVLSATASVTAGGEMQSERARSTYITGATFNELPIERRVVGSFAEWRQALPRHLSLTAGLRVEHIRRSALEEDPNVFDPRPAFPADTVVSANPRLTIAWIPSASGATRVHASAGTGIRPPDAFEIAFTDNPGLAPERSRSIEAGVAQRFASDALELEATVFRNVYDDLIVTVGRSLEDASRYRTDNVSNARSQGVELSGQWRRGTAVSLRASYTFLDTEILAVDRTSLAPPPFVVGDPLIRRPRHQGNLDLIVTKGHIVGFLEAGARGRTLDIEPNYGAFGGLFPNAGFLVANGGVSVHVHRTTEAFIRGLNLFDRRYEETLGFPALGRSVVAGVRVALSR